MLQKRIKGNKKEIFLNYSYILVGDERIKKGGKEIEEEEEEVKNGVKWYVVFSWVLER